MVVGRLSAAAFCLSLVAFAAVGCGGGEEREQSEWVDPEQAGFVACKSFARCRSTVDCTVPGEVCFNLSGCDVGICANYEELCERACKPENGCGSLPLDPSVLLCETKSGREAGYE